jgi:hypothetical protein
MAKASSRPARILYISDFDPAGVGMPVSVARKIEFLVRSDGEYLDVQVCPVVLTEEQCRHYRLPRTPIKDTDKRARRFEARFGEGATELDALESLHPGELEAILVREIRRYYDLDLQGATEEKAEEVEAELDEINERIERWRARAETVWQAIGESLQAEAPDIDLVDWPEADEGNEDSDPSFDSTRDYVEQIDRYKDHQDKPTERRKATKFRGPSKKKKKGRAQ